MWRTFCLEQANTNRETFLAEKYIFYIGESNAPRAISIEELMAATKKDATLLKLISAIQKNSCWHNAELKSYGNIKD